MGRIFTWSIVAFALAAVVWSALAERPLRVQAASVTSGSLTVTLDEEGTTRVRERHRVLAPLDGLLHRLELDPGDAIVAGATPLVTVEPLAPALLDDRSIAIAEARVGAVHAALERGEERVLAAQKLLRSAEQDLARQRSAGTGVSAQSVSNAEREVLFREAEVTVAQADVGVAQQELKEARAALLRARPQSEVGGEPAPPSTSQLLVIRAPVSGKVLRVLRESEGPVRIGEPLLEVGDTAQLEIVADYLTSEAVRIEPGMHAIIDGWGGEEALSARVRRVEPAATTQVSSLGIEEQRVNVVLDLIREGNESIPLGDGFRVQVRVVTWRGEELRLVPESALSKTADGWSVFRIRDGRAAEVSVDLGHRDGRFAEVLGGLSAGDRVVLYPSDQLSDGAKVKQRASRTK